LADVRVLVVAALVGIGATLLIDLWALLLRRGFGVRSLDYCLLGRWLLHMPEGWFAHRIIGAAAPKRHECAAGWTAHYLIGTTFSLVFVLLVSPSWLERPRLAPALLFGIVTAAVPLFVMQPALGLGVASSRTPNPGRARLKSLGTHAVFGLGLYLSALLLSRLFR
jgi:hypothetical protein